MNIPRKQLIYCCGCNQDVQARLTDGMEVYPHREDLYDLPFWRCDTCNNFVGCHHKTEDRTKPLGSIPSPAIKKLRMEIHAALDPIWMTGKHARKHIYKVLSTVIGREYHTADIRTNAEANLVFRELSKLASKPNVK